MPYKKITLLKKKFLANYPKFCRVGETAKSIGIERTTVYSWLHKDKDFAKKYDELQKYVLVMLEDEAFRRAYEGVDKPVGFYQGHSYETAKEYSDTLLIQLLKALAPDKYRERHELSGPGGVPLKTELQIIVQDSKTAELLKRVSERTGKQELGNSDSA